MSMKVTKEQFVGMTYDELLDENAKLVDVLHEVETEAVYAYRCLQQDCVTTAESSEHFFEKWWHAECELDRVKAENAKLRELVADTLMQPRDYCQKYDIEYDNWDSVNEHLDARLRELGVEVDE